MDLQTLVALNEWWQKRFDEKHPETARRRKARDAQALAVGDVCPSCHLIIKTNTHTFIYGKGFKCLKTAGARKPTKK